MDLHDTLHWLILSMCLLGLQHPVSPQPTPIAFLSPVSFAQMCGTSEVDRSHCKNLALLAEIMGEVKYWDAAMHDLLTEMK